MRDVTGEKQAPSGHPRPLISLAANPFDFRGVRRKQRIIMGGRRGHLGPTQRVADDANMQVFPVSVPIFVIHAAGWPGGDMGHDPKKKKKKKGWLANERSRIGNA